MQDDEILDLLLDFEASPIATRAERLEAQADSMSPGEYGRVSFFLAAGEHWQMRQEYDDARRCYQLALDDGGESRTDPLANLLDLALETGDEATAQALDTQLRGLARDDQLDASACHFIGETFEVQGRLRDAARWFTIPLTWIDPEDEDEFDVHCLFGRHRVRRELGLPVDRYDQAAALLMEEDE